jgi:hypothetical protein
MFGFSRQQSQCTLPQRRPVRRTEREVSPPSDQAPAVAAI